MRVETSYGGVDFYINVNENSFDLYRLSVNNTEGSKGFGQQTEKGLGYFTSLTKCIDAIIKSSLATTEETVSLKELIEIFNKGRQELAYILD